MPKDYQISQYDQPINVDGSLELPDGSRVGIDARPHRGGHGEDHPRRRRPGASTAPTTRSSTTTGPACRCVEIVSEPDIRVGRAGPGLRERAARHPRRDGRVRRQDGGGLAARRRQRVGATGRLVGARHPLRDQEHELAALARPCHRLRGRTVRSRSSRRARRSCRRRGTGTRARAARARCARRRRRTTTATSPSPTSCRSSPSDEWLSAVVAALPPLPAARRGRARGRRRRGPADVAVVIAEGPRRARCSRRSRPAPTRVVVLTHAEHNVDPTRAARPRRVRPRS